MNAHLFDRFRARFADRFTDSKAHRETHGAGEGRRDVALPDAVIFAENTEEVAEVVRECGAAKVPIIPFGTGTSLEGQVQAVRGGVSLDLSRMDRILEINQGDLDCRVQAGVTREALNVELRDQGLFFPLDPGANASLGGMAATRASGTNAVRYGTMRDVTLGLTVVDARGQIIRTGSRARKSSTGYDLTRLFVGSEGTLGIITELQLRLFGIPEQIAAAVVQFPGLGQAVDAVVAMLQCSLPLARIELLDKLQMRACIQYSKLDDMTEADTLFLEFHGSPKAVDEQISLASEICDSFGGGEFRWAQQQEDRNRLWTARHNAYWAARGLRPGAEAFATDACVPISSLPECILRCRSKAAELGIEAPVTGHVGDGNFHMLVLFDPKNDGERDRADALTAFVARTALDLEGTVSGEHGIGLHKRGYMEREHGAALDTMARIKRALDPDQILNPGKILPDQWLSQTK